MYMTFSHMHVKHLDPFVQRLHVCIVMKETYSGSVLTQVMAFRWHWNFHHQSWGPVTCRRKTFFLEQIHLITCAKERMRTIIMVRGKYWQIFFIMVLFQWMETPQILALAFSIRILSPVSASILLITMVSFIVTLNCLPPVAKKEVKFRQKP